MDILKISELANPKLLFLLFLLIPIIVWYVLKYKNMHATMQISTIEGIIQKEKSFNYLLQHILFGIRCLIIALVIIALARPQSESYWEDSTTEGIDIIIALDISSSMLARDLKPDRLEASKDVALEFIAGRRNDRIGLVVYSGESFTQCPLTTDHAVLSNLFKGLQSGMIEDGTAIGLGLATAINRLKDSKAKSKVIILLTDGVNNMGSIGPTTAAEIAKAFNIRVYTIGVGTKGEAPYPFKTMTGTRIQKIPVEIDEDILKSIADMTGGQYFRATNTDALREIYQLIDELEKSKIDIKSFSKKEEKFILFAIAAGFLLLLEIIIRITIFRNIP